MQSIQSKKLDQRKLLLFLPVVTIPFLALAFYALGGGGKGAGSPAASKGINTALPGAQFKQPAPADKMAVYQLAAKDSVKAGENGAVGFAGRLGFNPPEESPQAKAITEKLAAITKAVNAPVAPGAGAGSSPVGNWKPGEVPEVNGANAKEVTRLEGLLKNVQQNNAAADPQMAQLNAVMEKLLDLQHPERVKEKLAEKAAVSGVDSLFHAVPAVIDGKQKVMEGSVVRIRLLDTLRVNGQVFFKGQLLFGLATISNQRLNLEVKNIRREHTLVPVNLTVFDQRDAMSGINAPEAELAGAVGDGSSNALGSMQFLSMDQGLGAQAAGAGIDAARSLFAKKVKKIRVKLKDGYPLLLRDNTQKPHS